MQLQIEPIAAESFGVRSMCTFVKTADLSIIIDPGCSLGQRMRLDPHPLEYKALYNANQRLIKTCEKAEVLTISHYHYDHLKPFFTDYHFILSNRELAELLYTDKIILAKDFRENINASQRQRGYFFNRFAKKKAKEIIYADGKRFEFGNTTIFISKPLSHGERESKQGFVIACKIQYEDEIFVFATVQGPIVPETLTYLLSLTPTILYVGGPPLYLKGYRVSETILEIARSNLTKLAKNVPILIIDHHLLRAPDWKEWLEPVYSEAKSSNHWIGSAAEYSKKPVTLLEAVRKDLYAQYPPPEEFIKWTNQTDKFKKEILPPILESPY